MSIVDSAEARQKLLGVRPSAHRKLVGRMGNWQLVRMLGEGALTRVYLAQSADAPDAQPAYAIKALRKEWWHDPVAIDTLRREAWMGAKVSHPHLAPVLAAHVSGPPFYLVLPRLVGQTLAAYQTSGQRLAPPMALWILRQVAEALAALHESGGVIHGDVKPANIMIGPAGHATLLDLGFCQTATETKSWAQRPVLGTLNYLAPERLVSACSAGPQSDLYSLGVVLYELLAGELPLAANDPAALIALHRQAKPVNLAEKRPDLPISVARLAHRLLAKDPLRRPTSAQEVARELVRLEIECFALRS
jgi:serine/threonine-protein kinase